MPDIFCSQLLRQWGIKSSGFSYLGCVSTGPIAEPLMRIRYSDEACRPANLLRTFRVTKKKADVSEHPEVFDHVGLLVNEPPGTAGLLFI